MFKIVFLISYNGSELFFKEVAEELKNEHPGQVQFDFFNTGDIDYDDSVYANCQTALKDADLVYVYVHGGLPYFKKFNALQKEFMGIIPSFINTGIDDENVEMQKLSALSPVLYSEMYRYHFVGGITNYKSFLCLALRELGKIDCTVDELVMPQWDGLYAVPAEYTEEQYQSIIAAENEKPVIGILVHYHNVLNENTRHIDALIDSIKAHGAIPYAMFTNVAPMGEAYPGLIGAMDKYFYQDGKVIINALIVTSGMSQSVLSSPGDGTSRVETSVFEPLDVPVFQAMSTYYSYQQWYEALAGLDAMTLGSNVFQTEFDGQIITVTVACTEEQETPFGIKRIFAPIQDRIDRVVRLAINWAKLQTIPADQKKIAIVLHNMPPRADMIGCAYGLDTPESVFNMYKILKDEGTVLENDYQDGQEIIRAIIEGLTNDGRFRSPSEMLDRAAAVADEVSYIPWFEALPEKVRNELLRDWGEVPGEFMVVDGKILVPGIINGNLFIGLQPPRGKEEKAEELYHSTDIVCSYQYLAFYRYLEYVFEADVIIHVGTHGTIEWLPGKEIGLSNECYPDIAIGDLPHIYPYIIDVPGEGAQAKRRTDAVIIDHLIPSMTESGTYGELNGVEEQIDQYYTAKLTDSGKLGLIAEEIWKQAQAMDLHTDLGISEEEFFADTEGLIQKMHVWISEIKSSKIKDGLHIFGEVPSDQRYSNMLRLLVTVPNDKTPSLREGLALALDEDLEDMLADPGKILPDGKTNAMHLEAIDDLGRSLFSAFAEQDFAFESIASILAAIPGTNKDALEETLGFVALEIKPRLDATTDELKYFQHAINGRFVIPGPSGSPSRGNATILPTGRNFYMVDPTALPSRSAWETGKLLGDQMLESYRDLEGKLPESIAIVVYAGETIKTTGDDIAEIMYLYGVRPVWIPNTNRVIDIEPIPLEELGRPRIDVTLRISGLFRDTFPNLIERIEDAVNLVAALDEDDEVNYIKKHVMQDFNEFINQGMQRERAFEQSLYRVFSDPPGTYGAGVDVMVFSKQWETTEDLGQAYINWGAHAYGKSVHGLKVEDVFSKRMETIDVTIKNISSLESDMLSSDDFFNYHGGLISAVKSQKGSFPVSYSTNAGDPRHVITKTIHEETSRLMRARINNPRWIEGLKEHGFKGAQEFSAMVDIVFGWDATSNVVDDWMYDSITNTYLLDEDLQAWIRENNPWALLAMSERLLEAAQRGMWDADEAMLDQIREIYLSVEGDLEDS
ncbi:MAG: cobaltochelatase subunit CobN [Coriobacteriia bacterium]|nr:cobaltochelatase subunit CobN [Coriobacteriia bacterium]